MKSTSSTIAWAINLLPITPRTAALNLVAGTDAHAKNYSLLLSGRRIRLAPLCDVASILPYDDFEFQKIKLSMKIGGEYKLSQIGLREWQKFAREMRIDRRTSGEADHDGRASAGRSYCGS